jgi:hypothetical protein
VADQIVGEINSAVEGEVIGGEEGDAFIAVDVGDRFTDTEIAAAAFLFDATGVAEEFDPREARAVEDRDFEVIDIDPTVVDAGGVEDGKEMLRGGDEDALAHEAGGVGDAGDVLPGGGEGEVAKVGAEEDDAGTGGGGADFYVYRNAVVQANTRYFDRAGNRLFKVQEVSPATVSKANRSLANIPKIVNA